ncbi:MAG TPA: hypothetical protein VNY52_05795 [Solirubrobacteraceae bacterium]|jgi:hypothetical protein|nr:hypothetical protein [Solirubrobacteraceae bacterium]
MTTTQEAYQPNNGGQDHEPVTRVIRASVAPATWRRLRVRAAERDQPMTEYIGAILEREADAER